MPSQLKVSFLFRSGLFLFLISIALLWGSPAGAEPISVDKALFSEPLPLQLPAFYDQDLAGTDLEKLFKNLPALPGNNWPTDGGGGWQNSNEADGGFNLNKEFQQTTSRVSCLNMSLCLGIAINN